MKIFWHTETIAEVKINRGVSVKDKFRLTQEQNIFVAKRNIVDYIYKSAKLEEFTLHFLKHELFLKE